MTDQGRKPYLALSIGAEAALALLDDAALAQALDRSGLGFVVLGAERFTEDAAARVRLDPSVLAARLSATLPTTAIIVAAALQRDHPYNLARRVATDDHVTGGRSGLLLGVTDRGAPAVERAWGGAGLGDGAPLDEETLRDAALAIARLWQSWPIESIVADRRTRVYAEAERILRVEHDGRYRISGPFTVPTTPQGSPVLAVRAESAVSAAHHGDGVDLVVVAEGEGLPEGIRPHLVVELRREGIDAGSLAEAVGALGGADGILLDASAIDAGALLRLLTEDVPRLFAAGALSRSGAGPTLRSRLGLPAPAPLLADAAPAFGA